MDHFWGDIKSLFQNSNWQHRHNVIFIINNKPTCTSNRGSPYGLLGETNKMFSKAFFFLFSFLFLWLSFSFSKIKIYCMQECIQHDIQWSRTIKTSNQKKYEKNNEIWWQKWMGELRPQFDYHPLVVARF